MLCEDSFDSNAIERFAYDPGRSTLFIFFKSCGVYAYRDVPRATFEAFRAAGSKGRFFRGDIREHFAFERLSPNEVGELERAFKRGASGGTSHLVLGEIAKIEGPRRTAVFF